MSGILNIKLCGSKYYSKYKKNMKSQTFWVKCTAISLECVSLKQQKHWKASTISFKNAIASNPCWIQRQVLWIQEDKVSISTIAKSAYFVFQSQHSGRVQSGSFNGLHRAATLRRKRQKLKMLVLWVLWHKDRVLLIKKPMLPVASLKYFTHSVIFAILPQRVFVPAMYAFFSRISIAYWPILWVPSSNPRAEIASVTSTNPVTSNNIIRGKIFF